MSKVDVPPSTWKALGTPSPDSLTESRLQLHWAVQLVAAAPQAFAEAESDFSHSNLGWIADTTTFLSRALGAKTPIHVGLQVVEFSLVVLNADADVLEQFPLSGRTLDDGYAWIAKALTQHEVGSIDPGALQRPGDDFPDHAVRSGVPFTGARPAERAEMARWFSNSLLVLAEVTKSEPGASAIRTWPHHFDIATLITVNGTDDPKTARSIGVGLSPGDSDYDEPYFYATPWPYPENATLSPLAGRGLWHLTGWTGAVLKGTRLVENADEETQLERARKFLASAIPAGRRLAGA